MGPFAVVALQPGLREIADLGDRFKGIGVEDFRAVAAIEAFDVRVLIGLARLDVMQRDGMGLAPIDEGLRDKLRAVVPSNERATAGQVLL